MALPILESSKYTTIIPSTGVSVEYRPFLVKEEKILMIAQETEKSEDMINAMKDIIRACTFNKVDPNLLTTFDLEFIFLKLRAKSIGEKSNINIACNICSTMNPIEIDLDTVNAPVVSKNDTQIMLTPKVGIKMRHVRVKDLAKLSRESKSKIDTMNDTIIASIHSIFDENGIYPTDTTPKTELIDFINSLTRAQMEKIETFISSAPQIKLDVNFTCINPECKHENKIEITGVQSFFE